MIHLKSPKTNTAFCGKASKYDIITAERLPDNCNMRKVCEECKVLYREDLLEDARIGYEEYHNRSARVKFHDWLEQLDYFGHSDFDALLYPVTVLCTLGLVIPAKYIAKLLLKAGV